MKDCLFCEITAGREPSEKVWENDEFLCIKNKYPKAPVHVLVMPKGHVRKQDSLGTGLSRLKAGAKSAAGRGGGNLPVFWGKMMAAVFSVVHKLNLSKTGYKLVSNGAGYNHFEHEHIHVLGGSKHEPAGQT
ncbi:HIT domain-containing protein [Patescibacteria group bacterium]|nr:HIT domain-containing protein [Patescibacteria group bacterium]MBU1256509.1 HIT domain-containing protein [Patescibacteria group bacterium]MBU1457393.1 HIT domain-containing protein [Patescibacteria group bacterium]